MRLDFKIVEIHAAENDAGVGRRRHQAQVALDRGVQADAFDLNWMLDGKLAGHLRSTILMALWGPRSFNFTPLFTIAYRTIKSARQNEL